MTANLSIPLHSAHDVLAIPLAAVFSDQGIRYAYVKKGTNFEKRDLQIGVTDYDFAEIIEGLEQGEIVSLLPPAEEMNKVSQFNGRPGMAPPKTAAASPARGTNPPANANPPAVGATTPATPAPASGERRTPPPRRDS